MKKSKAVENSLNNDERILQFARREAEDIQLDFRLDPGEDDGYTVTRDGSRYAVTGTNARSCLHGLYHIKQGRPLGSFKAAFPIRGINPCESLARHTPEQLRDLIDRMGRWRMNTLIVHVNYGWRFHKKLIIQECAKRGIEIVFYVYTSIVFLPSDAPSHWLAKDEYGRPYNDHPVCETRLCLAEPDALDAFGRGAREFFANQAAPATSVLMQTGDGYKHCRCTHCRDTLPSDQWLAPMERFINAGRDTAPDKLLETIIYVQRFKPPKDMSLYRELDRLFYDLHIRNRWRPLGDTHPVYGQRAEADVDPDADDVPVNVYLFDRLKEWREKFPGRLYAFENLQLHGTLSCPQPNTAVLLEDLRRYRDMGLQGAVYEVLDGMTYFTDQVATLAEGLWNPDIEYRPTRPEQWCGEHCPPHPLFFLKEFGFPLKQLEHEFDEPLREHIRNCREFYADISARNLKRTIEHMYAHPGRFERMSTAFRFLKMFHTRTPIPNLNDKEKRFLDILKLWDFMEPLEDAIGEVDEIVRSLLGKL